ncbi:protein canopy-1 [Salmo trutta]|uniref:Canopy FGF signaling regulator 1 n=1 Tax=Salmo trutta TaxID=8032 RepID=A0A674E4I0_SALTR|nr:protein canopy-1-like [Salmo trutta]
MNMAPWIIQIALVAMSILTETTEGKKDKVLYCSACRAIVDELNYSISQIDPKKTIHVGGFRLNPDGSLTDKKVPLARSESNLSELLDGVCGSMSDYALHMDPDTKIKQYKRFAPRSSDAGDFPDFNNFKFDGPEGSNALKFVCESIVEEFEDYIISLFAKETDHVVDKLCNEVSDHCKGTKFQSDEL